MSRWFRVYDDLVDDPKVQRLSPEIFKALINIWCLASRNAGILPAIADIAFSLRVKPERASKMLSELRMAGLLEDDETGCHPHNWQGRQFKTDVIDPTNSERQKRWRNRMRNGKDVTDTVTRKLPDTETDTDTDTDTEKKKERARGALAPGWPRDYADVFWEAFPNKIGKKDALQKLERVARSGTVPFAEMMAALERYANKTDDRPFCNPATWINQERWTDQPRAGPPRNGNPTLAGACDDLLDKLNDLDRTPEIRGSAGQAVVRFLPAK